MTELAGRLSTVGDQPTLRPTIASRVPVDWMRLVRITLMTGYLIGYLWWLRTQGLPIDRISVAFSLFIFLACAFIGKPLLTWLVLIFDVGAYALMWYLYEITRGGADGGPGGTPAFPIQAESLRNIDRFLFFGHDPNLVLQRWLMKPTVTWYEKILSTVYFTHFVFPIVCMAVLWVISHRQWGRFMRRFATLLFIACIMFIVLPSAPPWMLGSARHPYKIAEFASLKRNTGRGFVSLGFSGFVKSWVKGQDWANEIAAMPSLHCGFALIVPLFFFRWIRQWWVKALLLLFPATMLFALVFFGEHWVIDGLVGWAIVVFSFWLWNRLESWWRRRQANLARAALDGLAAPTALDSVDADSADADSVGAGTVGAGTVAEDRP